jgi:hypothetical protein
VPDSQADDFYVAYRPAPPRLRRFARIAAVVIILSVAAIAALAASRQRDPGTGTWNLAGTDVIEGTFLASPSPMIVTEPKAHAILLVGEGKVAAAGLNSALVGRRVSAWGHLVRRGELSLLELTGGLQDAGPASEPDAPASKTDELVELTGEIIDPKCYAGAMKPGDGKPHKACAVLCLRGGIPPVFLADDGRSYLVVDDSGRQLAGQALEPLIPFVADRVRARAKVWELAGQPCVTIDVSSIKRL